MTWRATVLTLFPEMFPGPLGVSLAGQALKRGHWRLDTVHLRDFGVGRHRSADDKPFGGGPGMVLRPDVVDAALTAADLPDGPVIYLTPRGRLLDQETVHQLAAGRGMTLVCGRYEGIDQRVVDAWDMREISIGDYVLSGGEPAAVCILDAIVRLLPNVMGNAEGPAQDSFQGGLLEHTQFTRPANWQNRPVPPVLLSGDHARIADWRRQDSLRVTAGRRPDLWTRYVAHAGG